MKVGTISSIRRKGSLSSLWVIDAGKPRSSMSQIQISSIPNEGEFGYTGGAVALLLEAGSIAATREETISSSTW